MKTPWFGKSWVIPLLGIAVAVGVWMARTHYLRLEQQARSAEVLQGMMDRLYHDQHLGVALKRLHEGDVDVAVQRLDVLLCDDILRLNSELEGADENAKRCVGEVFRRIARVRPVTSEPANSGTASGWAYTQTAAQRILSLAMANEPRAQNTASGR
jgi:hypothetical protein